MYLHEVIARYKPKQNQGSSDEYEPSTYDSGPEKDNDRAEGERKEKDS